MVAKITFPKSIKAALNYNEKKVQQGNAVCLEATNFLSEAHQMNFHQKLKVFDQHNRLNERAKTNTMHISLNFDPKEKLSYQKLTAIAHEYMQRIGFYDQPFLVYRHFDAAHPHLHIVSTIIRANGDRINTHNIGRNQSEMARKEIERYHNLIPAKKGEQNRQNIIPVNIEKAIYGKHQTRRAISNVAGEVFSKYKYKSLAEFNAVLQQFNVIADRGRQEGRIYKHGGLIYRLLDKNGNKIGVPIKASLLAGKQTLKKLEEKFEKCTKSHRERIETKSKIDAAFHNVNGTLSILEKKLSDLQINAVLRRNPEGRIYGITFVDNNNKCVFNGSELGKGYSIGGIQARLFREKTFDNDTESAELSSPIKIEREEDLSQGKTRESLQKASGKKDFTETLFTGKDQPANIPYPLLKKKKRKRKGQN